MKSIFLLFAFAISTLCLSQYTAEFRSNGSGNWETADTWEVKYDGDLDWHPADEVPGASGHSGVSVEIQCKHVVNIPLTNSETKTFKIEKLSVFGALKLTNSGNDSKPQVTINTDNNFLFLIKGGFVTIAQKVIFQLPANTIISVNKYDDNNIFCPENTPGDFVLGFNPDGCDNSRPTIKIGEIEYTCQEKHPSIYDINNNSGTAIGALGAANPSIVCYYDDAKVPDIIASYMNYTGDNNVTYTLTYVSRPSDSNFPTNFSKSGIINKTAPQATISLGQALDKPGDYKFKLNVTVSGDETKTNDGYITIRKGDESVFANGEWDVDKGQPTLFNGLSAVINSDYDTSTEGSFDACSCEVKSGKTLTIGTDDYVRLLGRMKNDGTVIVENDGNLVQIYNDAVNTGDISVQKKINFSTERKQYNFLTSPVVDNNKNFKNNFYDGGVTAPSVQEYNTATYYFDEVSGQFISGKGYAVKEATSGTPLGKLTGIPFNGLLSYPLNTAGGGFNLVGNPYPSNIDLVELYNDNKTKIMPTFYFWDNRGNQEMYQQGSSYNGDSYAKYNALNETGVTASAPNAPSSEPRIPTKDVKVGTGFMVQATASDSLNFKNAHRLVDNSGPGFFGKGGNQGTQKDRYWLTMTSPDDIQVMNAVVYFEGGKNDFWIDDSESFLGSDDIYTLAEGNRLSIQGRAPFADTDELPLGYKAFKDGTYVISVYQSEGVFADGQQIYLIDKLLNRTVNLSEKPYKFLTRPGMTDNRFMIVYKPGTSGIDIEAPKEEISGNEILITKRDNQLIINSSRDKITEIEFFNLNNVSVYKKSKIGSIEFSINTNRFRNQIFVVVVTTEKGEHNSKKIVIN